MAEKDTKLNFKPLSDGLGFHPFSNGLPYSPSRPVAPQPALPPKKDYSQGTGALSGGRPTFAFPTPTVSRVPAPAPIVAKAPAIMPDYGWDYLIKRVLSYFIDSFLNMSLGAGVLIASLWGSLAKTGFDLFFNPSVSFITLAFLLFFNWAIITAQEIAFGTSIGKKFFGLGLDGSAGAILARALFFIPSSVFLGIGVLWSVLDSNRRGFHDLATGLQPEEY